MQDSTLSQAVWVMYGSGYRSGRYPNEVIAKWGADDGAAIISRIEELEHEAFATAPDWRVETLLEATHRVRSALREKHPELTDSAVQALGNYFAFGWK